MKANIVIFKRTEYGTVFLAAEGASLEMHEAVQEQNHFVFNKHREALKKWRELAKSIFREDSNEYKYASKKTISDIYNSWYKGRSSDRYLNPVKYYYRKEEERKKEEQEKKQEELKEKIEQERKEKLKKFERLALQAAAKYSIEALSLEGVYYNMQQVNKYLDLSVAMERTRGNWSEGYWRVEDALSRFTIESDTDEEIYNEIYNICYKLNDDLDGRYFRDATWDYYRVSKLAPEELVSDYNELYDLYNELTDFGMRRLYKDD